MLHFITCCTAGIARRFGGENIWQTYSFQAFGWKKVWRMNRSAKGLLMVTTNLDGISLANRRQFNKLVNFLPPKLSHYTVSYFPSLDLADLDS